MLALNLLGPFELVHDGRVLACRSRKLQALLLRLALAGPQMRAALVSMLWPELDESSGRRNLRRDLFRLRNLGAADAVQSDGDWLRLADSVQVDAARFAESRIGADVMAALALWRGPLAEGLDLPGVADFSDWLARERERLGAQRRDALDVAAGVAEAAGQAAEALAWRERLLAEDPLQERHHRSTMRLLMATGRREEALQQFERCRVLLADELGLQPMPETLALARSLRDEPPPAAPPPVPVVWPSVLPFVGREAEVACLQRAWTAGRPLLLVGEAGIGKTRLASDFAAAQGAYALVRCQPGDAELPFGAFARALRVLAGQPPDLGALDPWIASELARVLPELGPAPPPLRNEGERLRFDEACIQAWMGLSRGAFDAIVLDDWHLADAASRTLLARAAARRREGGAGGAIEILAWRGAADEPALVAQAEALAAERVLLERLPPAAVLVLVQQLTGAATPVRFAARLGGATGGLPFFLAETLRDLVERRLLVNDPGGRWHTPFDADTTDYRELPLAASVRDAVQARLHRLDVAVARLLEAAALAGEPFVPARLAAACALSEAEALQALEQAAQAQLVQERETGGYGWVHDLARQAIDASLSPTRRRLLHHRLALAAEAAAEPLAAARHFEACGEPPRAARYRLAAGDAAQGLQALAEAAAQWRLGLADRPAPNDEAALLGRLAEATWALGAADEARSHHERLQELLERADLEPSIGTEAQLRSARYLVGSGQASAALALLDAMPRPSAGTLLRRWWLGRIGALQQCGRLDEAMAQGLQALQLPPGSPRERADLLMLLALIEMYRGQLAQSTVHATAALAQFARLGDDIGRARALYQRGCSVFTGGDPEAGAADLREAATLAARMGHVHLQRQALYNLATVHASLMRSEQSLAIAREGWATLAATPHDEMAVIFRALFIEAHHVRGEWGPMWAHLGPAVDGVLALGQPLAMIGVATAALEPAAALGQWPRVRPLVEALERTVLGRVTYAEHVMLACAQAALIRGEAEEAGAWLQRMRPPEQQEESAARCRQRLLAARQRWQAAGEPPQDLPADDEPGMNAELRLIALALRCASAPTPDLKRRARQAVADPAAHAGATLWLAQVLGPADLAAQIESRIASLAGWPEVQQSFRATWAG